MAGKFKHNTPPEFIEKIMVKFEPIKTLKLQVVDHNEIE